MPVVVPVKFAFAGRDLWFDPQGLDIMEADYAICKTERGTEIGLVTADPFEVPASELAAPLKPVLRIATDEDLDHADELADRGEDSMTDFRRLVEQNGLDMKPVGVEYLFGGEKAVFYFAAEDRVDFRQLVKDLSSFFHTRVDMRQIGVRDETRLVGGYAHCGQELCCTRFGGNFEPVSIRMAKEQDLPLNSSKISGVCGRLMCCLRYEFEAYKDFKSRAPKKKTLIETPLGKARIIEYNTPREQLVLRLENGKVFRVNLADMTATDENKARCESQGCTCRPDCVTRDVLESLDSPDLALALMELDRQNGVDVGDGLDRADRIVASGPTPRRKRMREEDAAKFEGPGSGSARGARGRGKGAGSTDAGYDDRDAQGRVERSGEDGGNTTRRRRRRPAAEGANEQTSRPQAGTETSADAPSGSRRRRRHVSEGGADATQGNASEQRPTEDRAPGRSRRRRHTAAADGEASRESSQRTRSRKPDVPSVADQVAEGKVKVSRRRPGDGGGAPVPQRDGMADDAASPSGDAPKKRRRRRSRKPRQDGGADGTGDTGNTTALE